MKTTVSSKGQVVLPAELRSLDGIEPGQQFDVERVARGERHEPGEREQAGGRQDEALLGEVLANDGEHGSELNSSDLV